MPEFKFEITESLGIISEDGEKWPKELNLVRWNDNIARYDIRAWNASHEKMGRGITLSLFEVRKLKELLNSLNI